MWGQDRFFNDKRKIIRRKENIKVLNSCWPYLMDKKSHSKWYWNFNYFIINMLIMKSKAHLDKKSLHRTLILQGTEGSQTHTSAGPAILFQSLTTISWRQKRNGKASGCVSLQPGPVLLSSACFPADCGRWDVWGPSEGQQLHWCLRSHPLPPT